MGDVVNVDLTVNGVRFQSEVPANRLLLGFLREELGLMSVRGACERAVCGTCTVLIDDLPAASCATFVFDVDGHRIDTLEGQLAGGNLSAVQQGFVECGGFQCGFCTPGMIMLAAGLLNMDANPTRALVREWVSSNICRCTGYEMIIESIQRAAVITSERRGHIR